MQNIRNTKIKIWSICITYSKLIKELEFEFIENCEMFRSMTHTRRIESAAKSVLWEGCLIVQSYPVHLWKENRKNSTNNISMSVHEVKWKEEKITNFTILKICTNNWKTECIKGKTLAMKYFPQGIGHTTKTKMGTWDIIIINCKYVFQYSNF